MVKPRWPIGRRQSPGPKVPYKLVVLGDGGVGKTALVIQLCLQHFVETYDPTIEDSYLKSVTVDGVGAVLDILDTAGQEEYVELQRQWVTESEAIILVYSISSRSSFSRVERFYHIAQKARDGRSTPICLIGNKSDRVTEREVSTTEGFELALSLDIEFFIECSAKNCVNIEKAFYDLIRSLRAQKVGTEGLYERKQTVFGSRLIIPEGEDKTSSGRNKLARSLVHAARTNNLKEAMEFLDAGADVNAQPSISGSALHEAAAHGYETMVSLLLKSGAGINSRAPSGISPLQGAAAGGHFDVVKSLIQQGANRDQFSPVRGTALHAAASRGQAPVVKYLLKQGSNPNEAAGPYEYALHAGSWFGSVGVVNALLDNGADMGKLTEEGCTPLHMAAFTGNVDVLQILINRGGKLYINTVSTKFGTALDAADKNGHFEAVQLLLEEKATKSGLQPRTLHERPNLVYPQQTGRADEPSRSIDNNDHKDKVNSDGPVQQKSSNESSKSMEETNGVVLTSKFDFGFSSSQKPPVDLTPRPLIQDLGFTTLHDPPNARADIVFVHGLQGHPEKTWTFKSEPESVPLTWRERLLLQRRKQRAAGSSVYWPYDLLCKHEEFASSRIMTWGYDTKVIREFFGGSDQQNISQHGNNLLVRLQQERRDNPARSLIFVAHSLGGIIVKTALGIAKDSQHQPQYLPVYSSVLGIVFLATPHNGSGTAGWGLIASNLTRFALQRPSSSILRGLNPNNEVLENLRRSFLQMLEDGHFTIHSFFETLPMRGIKGLTGLVVPYESAVVGHARKEVFLGITATHASICKFSGPSDPGYQAVFGALQDHVRASATHR